MVFDSRDPVSGPVRVLVPERLQRFLVIYPSGSVRSLKRSIRDWVQSHAREPLRARLHQWSSAHPLEITFHDKDCVRLPPMGACLLQTLDVATLARMQAARSCLLLRIRISSSDLPVGLWSMVAAGRALSAAFRGAVYDSVLNGFWDSSVASRDLPADGFLAVAEHTRILNSVDDRGLAWFTTVGMPQFGLPNLEVREVPPNVSERLGSLIRGVAQILVESVLAMVERRGPSRVMEIGPEIRITRADTARARGTPGKGNPGKGGLVRLEYTGVGRQHLEPFIELRAPAAFQCSPGAWLNQILDAIEPEPETILRREGTGTDLELEVAHRKALSELMIVKARFQRGLPVGSKLQIKHGFISEAGIEYMWVAVTTWKGSRIQGNLVGRPSFCPDLRSGDPVEIAEVEVYDWLIRHENGVREGAYTDQVLEREL